MVAAQQPIFISYSRQDTAVVERLRADLQNARISVWIDHVGLQPGTPDWDEALRQAIAESRAILLIASPSSRKSPYVRDELALARDSGKPIYPLWVAGEKWLDSVPIGFGSTQHLDLRGDLYAPGLARLMSVLNGTEVIPPAESVATHEPETTLPEPRNPYKGLRAFREDDAGDFFGRETLISELLTAIGDGGTAPRLRAVLGASGSGKSSVMMAGLLPKLRQGTIHGSEAWVYLDPMTPGAHPLERLTITLARHLSAKSQAAIEEDLNHRSMRGLHRLAREIADQPVILYIDQFEELFTLTSDESERRQFIDLLTTAVAAPDGMLYVLLTMRADFYDRPAAYGDFAALLESHHTLIKPLALADLYDVVQKPAALPDSRLTFDDGLVTEMVFAVREEAGALPLLQFTLDQLFQQRAGNRLTRAAYEGMGGVRGALAGHAESTYQDLSKSQKSLARALFLRLIEPGATPQDATRRRARLAELTLTEAAQTEQMRAVIDTFIKARLLTADRVGDDETVEVSHEALIREWPTLQNWLHYAREDIITQRNVSEDSADWVKKGRPTDYAGFYRGSILLEKLAWVERMTPSADERAFINAATAQRERDEITERERQARELQLAQESADNAQRAEQAQREARAAAEYKAVRSRRAALFAGVIGIVAAVIAAVALVAATDARVATFNAEQQAYSAATSVAAVQPTLTAADIARETADFTLLQAFGIQADSYQTATSAAEIQADAATQVSAAEQEAQNAATQVSVADMQVATSVAQIQIVGMTLTPAPLTLDAANVEAATLAFNATFSALEINRFSTLAAGDVIVPLITQTPGIFELTLTQIAVLNTHDPKLPENNMIDESGIAMVRVPAGCFFMGSDRGEENEQPVHEICFDASFWIDKTEVTQGDFERLGGQKEGRNGFQGANRPVETITWFEARDFCELRGTHLPTEAEWEYAARGPDSRVYPWGNEFIGDNVVWSGNQTADVGSRPAGESWVGALDMSGNVWEWTATIYDDGRFPYPYRADDGRNNTDSTTEIRILRGGSWGSPFVDILRTSYRTANLSNNPSNYFGFRCARSE